MNQRISLFSDRATALVNGYTGPMDPPLGDDDRMGEMAREEAQDEMRDAARVAEVFDEGGSVAYMPQQLAELVALASEVPETAHGVTAKLYEAIGMRFVGWVEDTLTQLALDDIKRRAEQ